MFACKFELENTDIEYFKWLPEKAAQMKLNLLPF